MFIRKIIVCLLWLIFRFLMALNSTYLSRDSGSLLSFISLSACFGTFFLCFLFLVDTRDQQRWGWYSLTLTESLLRRLSFCVLWCGFGGVKRVGPGWCVCV